MISQGALVLPKDAPKKGESWTTKVEMKNPAVGKQTVETTYTYDGTKDVSGTTYAVIRPQLKMDFESKPADAQASQPDQPQQPAQQAQLQMKIKDQSSDGEVLFNIKAGRLHSTSLKQNVTIDASVQGKPIQQKIDQKIDVTVSPAGAKESSEPKKAGSGEKAEKAEKAK
jgi:hypothetical protein